MLDRAKINGVRYVDSLGKLLELFKAETVGEALETHGWTTKEHMGILLELARNGDAPPGQRLAALSAIENKTKEALVLGGHIRRVKQQALIEGPDDEVCTMSSDTVHLAPRGTDEIRDVLGLLPVDVEPIQEKDKDECTGSESGDGVTTSELARADGRRGGRAGSGRHNEQGNGPVP